MATKDKDITASENILNDLVRDVPDFAGISQEAQDATIEEKSMGVWHCIKTHPQAVFFSMVLSTCLIMGTARNSLACGSTYLTLFL